MVHHSVWIDESNQRLYAFANHRLVLGAQCSTASNHREWVPGDHRYEISNTPLGGFHILRKDADYYSRSFQVPMLYALFFSDGRAIHGTYPSKYQQLGMPASGGCVRVTRRAAAALYGWARVGDEVFIVSSLPQKLAAIVHRTRDHLRLVQRAEAVNRSRNRNASTGKGKRVKR